ncbi:toast rack family protein [Bacillus tuaregi]|uniref:toast rack family protein n=1 Tax=Bacillus tuaregi TaxID=1816695 RepID=UPI0008F822DE|nr:toast rack family protein [Bacillus tuaregi]
MRKKIAGSIIAASFLFIATGCSPFFNGHDESKEVLIKQDQAEELELELNIGAGELRVASGAEEWIEGTIDYTNKKLTPDITYKRKGDKGNAVIKQDDGVFKNINLGEVKNIWDLRLNDEVPLDLSVNAGASDSYLDLNGLQLSELEVNAGVGDMTIDLSGSYKESFDASLHMGVGESTIILPKDVGVKIDSSRGIGEAEFDGFISKGNGVYVNEAYEDADVVISLKTELGIGQVHFKIE